MTNKVQTRTRL